MRVLITGATGFLGGALARRLLALGHEVLALGRDREKLAGLAAEGADILRLDLAGAAPAAPGPVDAAVHCAALSSPWGRAVNFHKANVDGTRTALELAQAAGARRFVHISTPSVYFRFRDQVGMREDAPLPPPVNEYVRTKRAAERLVLAADKLDPIVLRPRGIYGAGDLALLPRVIAAAKTRALPLMNGGRAATDLTYVQDVIDAIGAALTAAPSLPTRVFNISGGEALNVRDLTERVAIRAGIRVRWRAVPTGVVLAYARAAEAACRLHPNRPEPTITAYSAGLFAYTQTLNISAARAHLGWAPRIQFEEGLDRTFSCAPK